MFLGEDLLAYLVLAVGGALFVGNLLAVIKPPERQLDETNLDRAPVVRSLAFAPSASSPPSGPWPPWSAVEPVHQIEPGASVPGTDATSSTWTTGHGGICQIDHMNAPLRLTFVQSGTKVSDLPASPVEVAFVGRSNVGKSSLINALANQKQLARVSNTPGRTQLLNLFSVDRAGGGTANGGPATGTVMDLPGYGYAKASKSVRRTGRR